MKFLSVRPAVLVALAVVLALPACDPAPKEKAEQSSSAVDPEVSGGWSSLETFVGRYPSDSHLLESSVISPVLKVLLGDKFAVLQTNLGTQAPLAKDPDGVLYTSGNKQHEGGSDGAYLLIDPKAEALEVGLWQAGKLTVYKTGKEAIGKPQDIQTLIANYQGH